MGRGRVGGGSGAGRGRVGGGSGVGRGRVGEGSGWVGGAVFMLLAIFTAQINNFYKFPSFLIRILPIL